jgi:predicted dehydrogenase
MKWSIMQEAARLYSTRRGGAMKRERSGRREFLKSSITTAAGVAWASSALSRASAAAQAPAASPAAAPARAPRLRFGVIGINHDHINGQVNAVIRGGGELVSFYATEPDLVAGFSKRFPQARLARSKQEVLEDPSLKLILSSAIPNERAPLGIEVMRHGKDYMVDKPGITTLEQLAEVRRVQAETKRIYSIDYSERLENRATQRAGELVKAGAIGRVIQTVGLGPHKLHPQTRAPWVFEKERYGGILCDLASHQFDQFLFFTGSKTAQVVASQVANVGHSEYPGLEDFGDAMVTGDGGTGYIRVDWFTPESFPVFGDGRLTVLGTDGFIEIRKNIDIGGRAGGSHLFLVDEKGTRYVDSADAPLPYGEQLVDDVLNRTETAMPQAHCLLAMELAIRAEKNAKPMTLSKSPTTT